MGGSIVYKKRTQIEGKVAQNSLNLKRRKAVEYISKTRKNNPIKGGYSWKYIILAVSKQKTIIHMQL